jgi:hypothetical protein
MTFTWLDVDEPENEAFQRRFGVRGHPSVAIVDSMGETVRTFVGAQSAETLIPSIQQAIAP